MNGNRDEVPGPSGPIAPGYAVPGDIGLGSPGTINDGVPSIQPLPNGSPIDVTIDSM